MTKGIGAFHGTTGRAKKTASPEKTTATQGNGAKEAIRRNIHALRQAKKNKTKMERAKIDLSILAQVKSLEVVGNPVAANEEVSLDAIFEEYFPENSVDEPQIRNHPLPEGNSMDDKDAKGSKKKRTDEKPTDTSKQSLNFYNSDLQGTGGGTYGNFRTEEKSFQKIRERLRKDK